MLMHFVHEESGATAIEYALIASLIMLAIVGAVTALSNANIAMYTKITDAVAGAVAGNG